MFIGELSGLIFYILSNIMSYLKNCKNVKMNFLNDFTILNGMYISSCRFLYISVDTWYIGIPNNYICLVYTRPKI